MNLLQNPHHEQPLIECDTANETEYNAATPYETEINNPQRVNTSPGSRRIQKLMRHCSAVTGSQPG
jgi:hypothetical protein